MPKVAKKAPSTRAAARHNPMKEPSSNVNKQPKIESQSDPSEKEAITQKTSSEDVKTSSIKKEPEDEKTLRAEVATTEHMHEPSRSAASTTKHPEMPTLPTRQSNYLITIHLDTGNPDVTRLLSLAPDMKFSEVHDAIQIAFNWADMHACAFYRSLTAHNFPSGQGPPKMIITRLAPLGDPEENHVYDDQITLEQVYENPAYKGKAAITYEYDHGDSWDHTLSLIGRTSPDFLGQMHAPEGTRVLCIGGEGHHVAEDSGGYCGWDDLKVCFRKGKRGDPEDRRGWYEEDCANGGKEKKFDPYAWSIFDVNDGLMERFSPGVIEKEMAAIEAIKNEK